MIAESIQASIRGRRGILRAGSSGLARRRAAHYPVLWDGVTDPCLVAYSILLQCRLIISHGQSISNDRTLF